LFNYLEANENLKEATYDDLNRILSNSLWNLVMSTTWLDHIMF